MSDFNENRSYYAIPRKTKFILQLYSNKKLVEQANFESLQTAKKIGNEWQKSRSNMYIIIGG